MEMLVRVARQLRQDEHFRGYIHLKTIPEADDALIEARLIWWQAYQQKMDGFLYWGLNIWGRPHNDALPTRPPAVSTNGR